MEKRYKILVVDDEEDLCGILKFNLEAGGYDVETAASAEEAMEKGPGRFDLLLLDVMMGGMSGYSMAKKLKENIATKNLPVIFITARDTEADMLTGFNIGADDYISKPFSLREVMARVNAVLRRTCQGQDQTQPGLIEYKGLVLDMNRKAVSIDGTDIPFTRTEFEILRLLLSEPGKVFSRQQLIDRIWRKDVIVLDRTVDVNITRVRRKVGRFSRCIVTRQGFGYLFEE
ncbi:MAG: response regulator transcription factor [Prevotella sp.]|nr:response regulator transcription factor [Prevotella sp.]